MEIIYEQSVFINQKWNRTRKNVYAPIPIFLKNKYSLKKIIEHKSYFVNKKV